MNQDDGNAGDPDVPIGQQRVGDGHEDLRGQGQGGLAAGEDCRETWQHDGEQKDRHADGHDEHEGGIDQGAFYFFGHVALGDEVIGEFAEHGAHGTGDFRGANERDVIVGEYFREFFERGGEILAAGDVLVDRFADGGEGVGEGLFGEGVDGFGEGDAGIDHDGELHGEVDEFLALDAGALADGFRGAGDFVSPSLDLDRAGLGGFDVDDIFALRAEELGGVHERRGGDEAVDDLAALVAGLVGKTRGWIGGNSHSEVALKISS